MKVQLWVPPQGYVAQRWDEGGSMPPLGVLYLAAVLEEAGIEVDVVPADVLGYSWRDVARRISDFSPHILGATTTTENRFDSFRLARIAKGLDPGIVTVLGGPHISMARHDTLIHIPEVDVAVVGEGERTLLELVQAVESGNGLEGVAGIYHRAKGEVRSTAPRKRIEDLDSLPFPARHLVPVDKYNFRVRVPGGRSLRAQNIITSRGCPFDCYFCATPVNWGRRVRGYSPQRVLREMEHLIAGYGAEFIWFYDDTLNYNTRRLHAILDGIIDRKLDIKFCNEFRIDLVDKPLLEKMVKAGLVWGHFGVEAGSSRVRRDVVHKQFDLDRARSFVRWAGELGFVPNAFMIFSHHTETWEEAQETVEIMEELRAINPQTEFSTALLHVYPGTPLEALAKEEGIMPRDFSWARKKDMRRVHTLPAAQGYVPLFKDRLSWFQIADLVMRWSAGQKRRFSLSKILSALASLVSPRQAWVYAVFFLTMIKYRFVNLFQRKRGHVPEMRIDT
jgi:anaerobic magnesium-protoporphyrin IX monomethyl ester cyclase